MPPNRKRVKLALSLPESLFGLGHNKNSPYKQDTAMEEILELKELLLKGDIKASLSIVEELEEIGRKDIIKTIRSYAVILLLHLIKQQAENRTTKSWEVSIRNSVREIQRENKRRKVGGYYREHVRNANLHQHPARVWLYKPSPPSRAKAFTACLRQALFV